MRYGDVYSLWVSEQVKSGETGQCKRNLLDDGSDNPVYHLFPGKPSCSDRAIQPWLPSSPVYLGVDCLGGRYGAGNGTNSHVSSPRWCAQG